jgi:hypothetical protein
MVRSRTEQTLHALDSWGYVSRGVAVHGRRGSKDSCRYAKVESYPFRQVTDDATADTEHRIDATQRFSEFPLSSIVAYWVLAVVVCKQHRHRLETSRPKRFRATVTRGLTGTNIEEYRHAALSELCHTSRGSLGRINTEQQLAWQVATLRSELGRN